MAPSASSYGSDSKWTDVIPISQDDGGAHPLAAIAYSDEYSEAMSYLRAVMAQNEYSERALSLTEHIIGMNPAHYTIWLYRAKILLELDRDLRAELLWLNGIALRFQKNYQIWHHRQVMMSRLGDPSGEVDFITQMFTQDAKNYHVWSYRQWLCRTFPEVLTPKVELPSTDALLEKDVLNNSAWNHRFFLLFVSPAAPSPPSVALIERELEFAQKAIEKAPQNQSPWNYMRGAVKKAERSLLELEGFTKRYADIDLEGGKGVRSTHALDLLAEIYGMQETKKVEADRILVALGDRWDPIRKGYWEWRREELGLQRRNDTMVDTERAIIAA